MLASEPKVQEKRIGDVIGQSAAVIKPDCGRDCLHNKPRSYYVNLPFCCRMGGLQRRSRQLIMGVARIVAILVLLFLAAIEPTTAAQIELSDWSKPELIFETAGRAPQGAMALVGDESGTLHLFFSHAPDEETSAGIDYMHWDGNAWSPPRNILIDRDNADMVNVRAAIDSKQNIHLIWGGNQSQLFHATANAALAGIPQSWTESRIIGQSITESGLAIDLDDKLFVAYSEFNEQGNSVYITRSSDLGYSWSVPEFVDLLPRGVGAGEVGIATDERGGVHVTWTGYTLPDGDPLTGVYYAHTDPESGFWSFPIAVDDERHGEIGVTALGEDEIHLVWRSSIGGDGTFHQVSQDGGQTWFPPNNHQDEGGQSGLPSFAVDSDGNLHYVIGPGLVASWKEGELSPYVDVVGQDLRQESRLDTNRSAGERAVIASLLGNQLHVVFETNFNKLWHSSLRLDTPELTVRVAEPTAQMDSIQPEILVETASAEPTIAATVLEVDFERTSPENGTAIGAIVYGLLGSILLLALITFLVSMRRRA